MVTNGNLHYTIFQHIIDKGFAPDVPALAALLHATDEEVTQGLYALADYHGAVLHPHEPKVWVIHPFSLAPTNFLVKSARGVWQGNCAWCSLGVAALLNEDVTITTPLAAYDEQVVLHITGGQLLEKAFCVHFPVSMKKARDNVIYTCSNRLLFKNEEQINGWSQRYNIPKGDVQPVETVWAFAKQWYGNHLNPHWKKWTMQEAKEIFARFNLTGKTWELETSASRF